ncbi:superoxide dismutase family protein [Loktanella sp. SALINAS62]|uniref:superoxide dismutase family protein n=1 Tax=Loktanella sp. SALINAS62 TaxID=2706124 RepID=UPI001B8C4410|nr:superoxide dismutase family protein [Loktanella sp. SALINAS62]MBS1304322.1 superoxide dismutase family protein [Loktanella sp. SALINAS62]
MNHFAICAAAALIPAGMATAQTDTMQSFDADVVSNSGISGTVSATQQESGVMVVTIDLTGVPEGTHGVHIHETGDCSADDYSSAGGHLAGDMEHGVNVAGGPHPGDMPNAYVQEDGVLKVTYFNTDLTPDMLADADGAAFIVHAGADDYESQPSGDAGGRLACAVLAEPQA